MSMHLHHPSLSLSGKKKGKKKFRNSEEARKHRELEESWNNIQKKWKPADIKKLPSKSEKLVINSDMPRTGSNEKIPSLDTGWTACTKAPDKKYTGNAIIGISQMAKSNAVPVFNSDHIIEIARMRR